MLTIQYINLRFNFLTIVVLRGHGIDTTISSTGRITIKNSKYFDENFIGMFRETARELRHDIEKVLNENDNRFEFHYYNVDMYFEKKDNKITIKVHSRVA